MIEGSLFAWCVFLLQICLASMAGALVSSFVPWDARAKENGLSKAFGFAIAPFLAGILMVMILYVLPGASHQTHATALMGVLGALAIAYVVIGRHANRPLGSTPGKALAGYLLQFLLLAWCLALLSNSIFVPLLQNDALEYAMVGREIFLARTLDVYPLINPESNASGFFAPWTHPPLYVSLIYLASILQGHANEPGLMRLIAPWFLLSAVIAVVSMGRMRSTNVGWLTGILFISTPLLFLGADSALIDALPVSGMVLLMAVMIGARHRHRAYPLFLGGVLGLALWTHSQSILFFPLVVSGLCILLGLGRWRRLLKLAFVVLLVALLVGGAPYIHNTILFGSPISDNPLVFALPELDWQGYFRFSRGLDHWVAIIQYGVFKGWFSLEAYGWLFWLWAAGCVLFLMQQGWVRFVGIVRHGLDDDSGAPAALWLALMLVATYLGGVIASVALGIDLMIRNERYMLIIVPPLALCGAFFLEAVALGIWSRIHLKAVGAVRRDVYLSAYWVLSSVLLAQVLSVGWYYRWRDVDTKPVVNAFTDESLAERAQKFSRFDWILNYWPSIRLVKEMSIRIPEDALVLSMRPSDMYYAGRKMISYLDPRLVAFYQERSPEAAIDILKRLGVKYVYVSDYSLPPVYDSSLSAILSDPKLSRLVYWHGMSQVFALEASGLGIGERTDVTPGPDQLWTRTPQVRIGGRKLLESAGLEPKIFAGGESESSLQVFHRDYSVVLASGQAGGLTGGRYKTFLPVEDAEYAIRIELTGRGFVTLWLAQFDSNGVEVSHTTVDRNRPLRFGDLSLSEKNPSVSYARRFKPEPGTRFIRIGVEHVGHSRVTINQIVLDKLIPDFDVLHLDP